MMTERQRNKRRSERYVARYQGDEEELGQFVKPQKKKLAKNIMTLEQKLKKEKNEENRRRKLKEANEKLMDDTVQKILNDCSSKKNKLTVFEKREKKREELRTKKVIFSFLNFC